MFSSSVYVAELFDDAALAARLSYHTMNKYFTMATYLKDRASPIELAKFSQSAYLADYH